MYVVFIHGPAAAGKYTIGRELAARTGLPLFHNHFGVDAAAALFDFGTPSFNRMRAAIWRAGFSEAGAAGRSFIFTFHPEVTVDRELIRELVASVEVVGGGVAFVELTCSRQSILARLSNPSRSEFGKLTDARLYARLEQQGAFEFPALPPPIVRLDTDQISPAEAAENIVRALEAEGHLARRP